MDATAGIGHNQPPAATVKEQADEWVEKLDALLGEPVTTLNQNSMHKILVDAGKFRQGLEASHKAEKQPHLDAGRDIDDKFKPLIAKINDKGKKVKAHVTAFLNEQQRKADEAQRLAEAEALRLAEEAEAAAESHDPVLDDDDDLEQTTAVAVEALAVAKAAVVETKQAGQLRGGSSRAMGLKTVRTAVITDIDKLFEHFKDHPDVVAVLQKLADKHVKAAKGGPIKAPGIKAQEVKKL